MKICFLRVVIYNGHFVVVLFYAKLFINFTFYLDIIEPSGFVKHRNIICSIFMMICIYSLQWGGYVSYLDIILFGISLDIGRKLIVFRATLISNVYHAKNHVFFRLLFSLMFIVSNTKGNFSFQNFLTLHGRLLRFTCVCTFAFSHV